MFYFNARSILPKLDELSAICSLYSPHIVAVVETWLSHDILDSELVLPGYYLFRLDRNRRGGGVCVYVSTSLVAMPVHLPDSNPSLELLVLNLQFSGSVFNLATFYRPPSSSHDFVQLLSVLASLPSLSAHDLILVGDFNVDFSTPSPLLSELQTATDLFDLHQFVRHPTHYSHSASPSVIDLVFVPSDMHATCSILPPVSNSDHNSILLDFPFNLNSSTSCSLRRVWLYDKADFSLANSLLSSIPWTSILLPYNTEASWLIFKELFFRIMHKVVPFEMVSDPPCPSCPWISHSILSHIKCRNRLFSFACSSGSSSPWGAYRYCRNRTLSLIRLAKHRFFSRLSHSSNPKRFWNSIKLLRKKPSSIPTLIHDGQPVTSSQLQANIFCNFFSSCFNTSADPLPDFPPSPPPFNPPLDLLCSPEDVHVLLSHIPSDTSAGPDAISATMIKSTAFTSSFHHLQLVTLFWSSPL